MMKFINELNNTVYLEDIDRYIYYKDDALQEIDVDFILKSKHFQQLVVAGDFRIVEIGDSRIEKNLKRLQTSMAKLKLKDFEKEITEEITEKEPLSEEVEVSIKGHFLEGGGYAKVNRNLAFGLKKQGVNVKIDVVGKRFAALNEPEAKKLQKFCKPPSKNAIRLDSMVPSFSYGRMGKKAILYTTIESYTVTDQFLKVMSQYNEIWVTSDFCKQVLMKYRLKKPIFVLPDSINISAYTEDGEKYKFRPELKPFVFLSVFGWSYRKGFDVLLKSYLEEFSGDDPVTLLIFSKFQGQYDRSEFIKDIINDFIRDCKCKNAPHIVRCAKFVPESQMPSLYRACNAFVLFSRGEGFGLPYAEASLCGLPVIGTDCSGQSMFLKKDNSSLIDIDELAPVKEGAMHVHYWDGQLFPMLKSEQVILDARKAIRDVYENYDKAVKKNKKLKKFIKSNYSIEKVSYAAKGRLDKLWQDQ